MQQPHYEFRGDFPGTGTAKPMQRARAVTAEACRPDRGAAALRGRRCPLSGETS